MAGKVPREVLLFVIWRVSPEPDARWGRDDPALLVNSAAL